MNVALQQIRGRWHAPPQVPVAGSYWQWYGDRLVAAGGQLQIWQQPVATPEPGMLDTISANAKIVLQITHLIDMEVTSSRKAVDEIVGFNNTVWKSCPGVMLAIGPGNQPRLNATRDAIAEASVEKIGQGADRFRPMVAYEGVRDVYTEIDPRFRPPGQWMVGFEAVNVAGRLTEPRDDALNPPSWSMSVHCPLQGRVRAEMDGIIDDPRNDVSDLPKLPAVIGTLTEIMHGPMVPAPITRRGETDETFDFLYNEITTHRY